MSTNDFNVVLYEGVIPVQRIYLNPLLAPSLFAVKEKYLRIGL